MTRSNNLSSQNRQPEWEQDQLNEIITALEEQKCILILGNYAFSKKSSQDSDECFLPDLLKEEFQRRNKSGNANTPLDYYSIAQDILNRSGGKKTLMKTAAIKREELVGTRQEQRLRQISEIPFDLILSTYPFELLSQVFTENGIDHDTSFYSYRHELEELAEPSLKKPLIYNLFGSSKERDSMVISLDRLYEFMFGVLGVRPFPKLIQDKISQATHLVFMGFSFDDWYMKMLLRMFNGHKKDFTFANSFQSAKIGQNNRMFFESNFKVTFLEKEVDDFIDSLHQACRVHDDCTDCEEWPEFQAGKFLRQPTFSPAEDPFDLPKAMIKHQQFSEAMQWLEDILMEKRESSLLKLLLDHQGSFEQLKEHQSYDLYSKEELSTKLLDFRRDLSSFIDQVEQKLAS